MEENPVKLTPEERNRIIEEVFLPYIDDLERFLFRLTNNNPEATDDLVQETFLRVIKSVETFKEGTNAKAWLFMIGKNVFINKYRKDKKMPIDGDTETVKKHPHTT
ncbi:MAG TPA: sigma factor, partial [Chitinophagales bacterium]|nr:sigma factor [Chitinophagales bacterium]